MFCFFSFNAASSKLSDAGGIIFKQYYETIFSGWQSVFFYVLDNWP
jgi:hypothetical protein